MSAFHRRHGLTPVINAAGTFTPLGVSRSPPAVGRAVAEALGEFVLIDELQAALSRALAQFSGAEAAAATHCAAAAITLAVAATMTGTDAVKAAALPDSTGLPNRVVLPAGHAVDYGHPILTDIRLAGAVPVLAGSDAGCSLEALAAELARPRTACLLLVSSRLVRGEPLDLRAAVAAAHRAGVPALIDGAAQDRRLPALIATGADAVIVSAHKYLAAPTAGLVVGRQALVQAVRAQERGIGRAMKATKEAMAGVLAALALRQKEEGADWQAEQARKLERFLRDVQPIEGLQAAAQPDPAGMPFARAVLTLGTPRAAAVAAALKAGTPSIRLMEQGLAAGRLVLELVPLGDDEIDLIAERLRTALAAPG